MENKKATQEEIQLKMLLIGEQAVGKSSLINQYVEGKFELNLLCAAGLDLKKKMITVNNKQVKLMIYDSEGHERYRGLAKNQLHTTKGILIVYDVTERSSFEALNFWLKSYKENAESGSVCLVIGNKIDLNEKRVVSIEEGKNIAKEYGVHFIETSAKNAINVEEAFLNVAKEIMEKENEINNNKRNVNIKKEKKENKACCCFF